MGYYAGDFYAGMRGDPGIGGFFSGLVKSAVGMIPGVGPIASAGLGKLVTAATAGRGVVKAVGGTIMKHPALSAAGAVGVIGAAGAIGHRVLAVGRKCRKTHI